MTVAARRPPYKALEVTAEHPIVRPPLIETKPLNASRVSTFVLAGTTAAALASAAGTWMAMSPKLWVGSPMVTALGAFIVLAARGHFRVRMVPDTTSRVPLVGVAVAIGATMSMAVASTRLVDQPDAPNFVGLLALLGVAALLAQAVGVGILRHQWVRGNLRSKALVLGSDDLARELAIEVGLRKEYGVDVVGFIVSESDQTAKLPGPVYGLNADLAHLFDSTGADRLLVAPSSAGDDRDAVRLARWAGGRGIPVFVVPRMYELGLGMDSMSPDRARGYPLVRLQRAAHPHVSRRIKRGIDVIVAGSVLAVASPVMAVVAVSVKLSSPGPVLFGQERVGQHGRRIVIHKFRSMTMSTTSDREWTAEARVTPVGAFLRRSSLDELPQLWAIVRGDMSLVGPRPERPVFVERFSHEIPDYDARHRVPVGLTGLAQIVGLRGDTSIAERVKYDNLYIDQWSVGTDLQILAKTVIAIVRQHAYKDKAIELDHAIRGTQRDLVGQQSTDVTTIAQQPATSNINRAAS